MSDIQTVSPTQPLAKELQSSAADLKIIRASVERGINAVNHKGRRRLGTSSDGAVRREHWHAAVKDKHKYLQMFCVAASRATQRLVVGVYCNGLLCRDTVRHTEINECSC